MADRDCRPVPGAAFAPHRATDLDHLPSQGGVGLLSSRAKIVSRADLLAWRRGIVGPLVFTNGVFDILHPGHIEYLEAARALGAALAVGVNTDASARRLGKGPGRPLNDTESRCRVLAALEAVDRVTVFNEETPLDLIQALRPDVLVKGGDYNRAGIVGADFVESYGGTVLTIALVPGHSTTAIVERSRATS